MFPSNFNIPMGPPIKGEGASELYKTIAPDFKLPPQPTPLRPPPRFGPDNPAPRGPIQLRSPDNMIRGTTTYPMLDRSRFMQSNPQIADALALVNKRRVANLPGGSLSETMRNLSKDGSVFDKIREGLRPNVPTPPTTPSLDLGGTQKQYTENPELNSLYNQLRSLTSMRFFAAPGPEHYESIKNLENQITAAGGQPYQYFSSSGNEDNITSSPREGKYNPATGGFDEFGPPPSIDPTKSNLNQESIDSIRERIFGSPTSRDLGPLQFDISKIDPSKGPFDPTRMTGPGRLPEGGYDGGGINPGGMFDDISPFQPQVITKGLDGKDYPNPGAAERANRIFLANQAANQAADLGGDDMVMDDPAMLETPPAGGMPDPVMEGTPPTQPTPPTGEMPPAETMPPVTGDPNDPMSSLYGQIGVADEAGARDVIESILSGQQDQMTEDQRNLTGTGIYRRIANRLGIKDREGNLITPLSTVVTGDDRRVTPTGSQALSYLQDMEDMEGGTGIEMLLNFLQGRMRAPESRPTGPFGTVPGGGSRYGMPQNPYMPQMPYMPQPPIFGGGFGGFGGYGGYGSPGMGGYMGMRPSLPYAGMSSPMFPSIFGMAPPSYYGGMPSMYGNYGGGFPIANRGQQSSNGMQGMGMSNPMPGAGDLLSKESLINKMFQ